MAQQCSWVPCGGLAPSPGGASTYHTCSCPPTMLTRITGWIDGILKDTIILFFFTTAIHQILTAINVPCAALFYCLSVGYNHKQLLRPP